ncbi:hypothetical protein TBLA_0E03030 [Henningerozyma blattae CBS 6284]|uniref:Histone-lysine N-methyltransferase, H3 lysine-79 specific n=1 Tax=Henningerozyma blattae (strain ATCC 34711 / CBS 6284 / DSM 70876 / NBRC 10599 / NRRL Y-10934 / UCD 77-7) TaxID=1071380 RepID=I2H4Q5_HENB6|nr:hypothetical protein TBLA_0E03030 [Tetrapisispora blattae CBS 6284]CCH61357.1 hypothetical protein TBLA_0E03030 [Tetrapisispora blattae CBS 6284]
MNSKNAVSQTSIGINGISNSKISNDITGLLTPNKNPITPIESESDTFVSVTLNNTVLGSSDAKASNVTKQESNIIYTPPKSQSRGASQSHPLHVINSNVSDQNITIQSTSSDFIEEYKAYDENTKLNGCNNYVLTDKYSIQDDYGKGIIPSQLNRFEDSLPLPDSNLVTKKHKRKYMGLKDLLAGADHFINFYPTTQRTKNRIPEYSVTEPNKTPKDDLVKERGINQGSEVCTAKDSFGEVSRRTRNSQLNSVDKQKETKSHFEGNTTSNSNNSTSRFANNLKALLQDANYFVDNFQYIYPDSHIDDQSDLRKSNSNRRFRKRKPLSYDENHLKRDKSKYEKDAEKDRMVLKRILNVSDTEEEKYERKKSKGELNVVIKSSKKNILEGKINKREQNKDSYVTKVSRTSKLRFPGNRMNGRHIEENQNKLTYINSIDEIKLIHQHTKKGRKRGLVLQPSKKKRSRVTNSKTERVNSRSIQGSKKGIKPKQPHFKSLISVKSRIKSSIGEHSSMTTDAQALDESNLSEGSYFIPSREYKKINRYLFNLDYLNSHLNFDKTVTNSIEVSKSMNRYKSKELNPDSIVWLKNIIYPNFEEAYFIQFNSAVSRYNPMLEIGRIVEYTFLLFLPRQYENSISDKLIENMELALENEDESLFKSCVTQYNELVESIPRHEVLKKLKLFDNMIPKTFIHDFLYIIYTRSIHPNHNKLRQYKSFSSEVYGELLPNFLSVAFEQCQMKQEHVFMDLGCGVGNCTIQASLEYGCKLSFGCEIMKNASDIAEIQYDELTKRCELFGLQLGPIEFSLRQSFLGNDRVNELLPQCDILLLNNFLFDAKLNIEVEKLIQVLKPGTKVITLRNLKPHTYHEIPADSILNRLKVEKFSLSGNCVSWTDKGIEYYISTVMETITEETKEPYIGYWKSRKGR